MAIVLKSTSSTDEAKVDGISNALRVTNYDSSGVESTPLTDTQLRATPVPVSGTVSATLSEPISVDDNGSSLTVDGTVTVTQGTGSNLHTVVDSGTITTVSTVTSATVIQGTATSLKTQAENYQGGVAVSAAAPLQVTLANTGANTNKLLVTPDANSAVNVAQIAGTTVAVNTGTMSAGTQRVVLASDSTAISTAGFISTKIDQTTDGTTNKVRATGTMKPSYGSNVVMTVTNLQSLGSSPTAGWQSDRVSNTSTLATDYFVTVKLTTANTAPANDKAMYIYVCPWYSTDGGTTWLATDQGTTTLPTGTEGTTTIASPNNLLIARVINYTTQQMVVQGNFLMSNVIGQRMPHGWSLIIINYSGAALSTSCVVDYIPINDILV